ncbi:hypothetical protein PCIT_b0881 [Pseudoalteromonas citrea]|uniref:Uncharacterized protein n=1 Tax=Pseudoalteromonas citrea TaxID=43655 RepID=A0AAD4FQ86_9GAMM|nr:hypothetical protein PCIT_b0881 [Pseudoalteromonas citrea]
MRFTHRHIFTTLLISGKNTAESMPVTAGVSLCVKPLYKMATR